MNMIAVDYSFNGLHVGYNALSCSGTVGIDLLNAADKTLHARQIVWSEGCTVTGYRDCEAV